MQFQKTILCGYTECELITGYGNDDVCSASYQTHSKACAEQKKNINTISETLIVVVKLYNVIQRVSCFSKDGPGKNVSVETMVCAVRRIIRIQRHPQSKDKNISAMFSENDDVSVKLHY